MSMKKTEKQPPPDAAPQRKPNQKTKEKQPEQPAKKEVLTVVGIGASAGGLKALQAFFEALPAETGIAFVVITHLHPERESLMDEILQKSTEMKVHQVNGKVHVEPDRVYVIPPNRRILMTDSTLDVDAFEEPRGMRLPVDHFFRSLAKEHRSMVGVILSGGGTDGSVGLKAIKEQGGLVMVQDPNEAEYNGMPRAAIATGLVDVVLPVRDLAYKLVEYISQPAVLPFDPISLTRPQAESLQRILAHVQARIGHDFSQYKRATILRRVQRRMLLSGRQSLEAYLVHMRETPEEANAMFNDILIGVTNFFRDPGAWETLEKKVLPLIFQNKQDGDAVRIWTVGCSSGEEAYSLGMLLLEQAERVEKRLELHVFASDLDDAALAIAREGLYPAAIEADVSRQRLERFFEALDNHYQVKRELRDTVLFTKHSVLRDPPFSKQDLISCRNLLIYLNRDMHENVLDMFHYALNPGGYLFLGGSESADSVKELFQVVSKPDRIYKAKPWSGERPHVPALPLEGPHLHHADLHASSDRSQSRLFTGLQPLEEQHAQALEAFGPPSIWVDEDYLVLNLSETAGRYLIQPGGPITNDLLRLVRPELQIELRSALYQAFDKGKSVLSAPVAVTFNGGPHRVIISVRPERGLADQEGEHVYRALVMFFEDESEIPPAEWQKSTREAAGDQKGSTVQQLEQEVKHLRDRLQATSEEYNSSAEEMKAANEELQSVNEEYRSTTEELETSKEELQSVNEELQTVNNELRNKLEEVSRAHNDLENLMDATKIATLFLDRNLKIKRYTPGMEQLINIQPTDRGRHIADFTHKLGYQDLVEDANTVLRNLGTLERESTSPDGGWLLVRLRPYRTLDDRIEGVVISFVDITDVKRVERIRQSYESFYTLFHANPIPTLLIRLEDDVVMNANQALLDYLNLPREEVLEHTAQEFHLGLDLESKERAALTTQLLKDGAIRNFEEEIELPSGEKKTVLTSVQYIYLGDVDAIIMTFIDISDRVLAKKQVRQLSVNLTTAEQEERYRISQILHDDLQQRIFAIKMQLENASDALENGNPKAVTLDFAKLESWLTEAIHITRQLSTDLSPLSLKGEELPEVILWLASQMQEQYGLEVELEVDHDGQIRLENNLQLILFHAVRELLFNVVKHSGTLHAKVNIKHQGQSRFIIQVSDDGVGFDAEAFLQNPDQAHGLTTLQQRLMMFDCSLKIDSKEDGGTRVSIDCPNKLSGL